MYFAKFVIQIVIQIVTQIVTQIVIQIVIQNARNSEILITNLGSFCFIEIVVMVAIPPNFTSDFLLFLI